MRLDGLIDTVSLPASISDDDACAERDGKLAEEAARVEITALAYDSRKVVPGTLFFCVPGFTADGHRFAADAVRAGAAALVVERELGLGVPEAVVPSVRATMAPVAARFYGEPARELQMVGVTGTNGKTTTAYLVRALLEAAGVQCGLLGTVKSVVGGEERPVQRTTPEAIDLQAELRAMLDGGDRACVMEVSSHALALGRVGAIPFAAAIFTNISRDHLDFHPSMGDYFEAKRRLFVPAAAGEGAELGSASTPGVSVINVGDPYGRLLAAQAPEVRTFAVDAPADFSAVDVRFDLDGCRFTLLTDGERREVNLPMPGRFNVANALGALAAADALVGDASTRELLVGALSHGVHVPGRFEPVDEGQDFAVVVDYAHTPDSLENVLRAGRELVESADAHGKLVCVFGAGGDRDRGKRPVMGEIAARLADTVLVTSDNPRSEDPGEIIEEILDGVARVSSVVDARDGEGEGGHAERGRVRSLTDRRAAIDAAIAQAGSGDVVVIAGKGHEQGQEFAHGRKIPFDDVTVARAALRARTGSRVPAQAGGG